MWINWDKCADNLRLEIQTLLFPLNNVSVQKDMCYGVLQNVSNVFDFLLTLQSESNTFYSNCAQRVWLEMTYLALKLNKNKTNGVLSKTFCWIFPYQGIYSIWMMTLCKSIFNFMFYAMLDFAQAAIFRCMWMIKMINATRILTLMKITLPRNELLGVIIAAPAEKYLQALFFVQSVIYWTINTIAL